MQRDYALYSRAAVCLILPFQKIHWSLIQNRLNYSNVTALADSFTLKKKNKTFMAQWLKKNTWWEWTFMPCVCVKMWMRNVQYVYLWLFLSICLSLCPSDLVCASCLKFQRNRRIRRHPELIDFPKTWAQNMTIYESARDKCCVCLSKKHIFLLFPFWKYGFGPPPITGSVFSSCCAKNYSMLLFLCWSFWLYLLLCFVLCGESPSVSYL